MKRACAWCKKDMGTVPSDCNSKNVITHGICSACASIAFAELEMEQSEFFLESLAEPVLVVDGDVVALTANSKARQVLGKELSQIKGFKGGDIIECTHAHEPGGCGGSIHCSGCAIRRNVEDTYVTGNGHLQVPAYADIPVEGTVRSVCFLISTEKVAGVVLLRIDSVGGNNNRETVPVDPDIPDRISFMHSQSAARIGLNSERNFVYKDASISGIH